MDIARLFDCPLCTGIPEREREQFIEGFDYSVKSYMKGEVVSGRETCAGSFISCWRGKLRRK